MSILSEITRLLNAKEALKIAIGNKGSIITNEKIDVYPSKVDDIDVEGLDVSDATASAANILAPLTAYGGLGKMTGTMPDKSDTVQDVSPVDDAVNSYIKALIPALGYYNENSALQISYADLATLIGLAAEKIVEGNTIIGIEGNASGGIQKGIIIIAQDASGYPTQIEVTGFTSIPPYMFYNYGSSGGWRFMTSVTLPNDITVIGSYAFNSCMQLAIAFVGNSLATINSYAFYDCENLVTVSLPDTLRTIGANAFKLCYKLAITTLPPITSLGQYAFANCQAIVSLTLPNSLITIPQYCFTGCNKITTFNISPSVTTIEYNALDGCSALRKIWIPATVTTINATNYSVSPFQSCSTLLVIYCEAASKPAGWGVAWNYRANGSLLTVNWGVTKEQFDAL